MRAMMFTQVPSEPAPGTAWCRSAKVAPHGERQRGRRGDVACDRVARKRGVASNSRRPVDVRILDGRAAQHEGVESGRRTHLHTVRRGLGVRRAAEQAPEPERGNAEGVEAVVSGVAAIMGRMAAPLARAAPPWVGILAARKSGAGPSRLPAGQHASPHCL